MPWLLVLTLLCLGAEALLCDESTYTEYYFELCLLDPVCQAAWNLYPDEFTAFDYLMITQLMQPREFSWHDVCDECHEAQWLANLRVHRVCPPNYDRYGAGECRCRSESQCTETPPGDYGFAKLVIIAVATIFVVYIGFHQIKQLKSLHTAAVSTATATTLSDTPTSNPQQHAAHAAKRKLTAAARLGEIELTYE